MNQRLSGRKVTSVSTNVKSIVPRPRVPEVPSLACDEELRRPQADTSSTDLTETASSESETQGQSVGSGEKARRKFSSTFVAPSLPTPLTHAPGFRGCRNRKPGMKSLWHPG